MYSFLNDIILQDINSYSYSYIHNILRLKIYYVLVFFIDIEIL